MLRIQTFSHITKTTVSQFPKKHLTNRCVLENTILHVVSPLVAYSLKGDRDRNLSTACQNSINKIKQAFQNKEIDESTKNSRINEISEYYKNAKKLPAKVSSSEIKKGEPTFGSLDNYAQEDFETGIETLDISLPTELQEYLDSPIHRISSNFMGKFDEIKENLLDNSERLFDSLKSTLKNIIEM